MEGYSDTGYDKQQDGSLIQRDNITDKQIDPQHNNSAMKTLSYDGLSSTTPPLEAFNTDHQFYKKCIESENRISSLLLNQLEKEDNPLKKADLEKFVNQLTIELESTILKRMSFQDEYIKDLQFEIISNKADAGAVVTELITELERVESEKSDLARRMEDALRKENKKRLHLEEMVDNLSFELAEVKETKKAIYSNNDWEREKRQLLREIAKMKQRLSGMKELHLKKVDEAEKAHRVHEIELQTMKEKHDKEVQRLKKTDDKQKSKIEVLRMSQKKMREYKRQLESTELILHNTKIEISGLNDRCESYCQTTIEQKKRIEEAEESIKMLEEEKMEMEEKLRDVNNLAEARTSVIIERELERDNALKEKISMETQLHRALEGVMNFQMGASVVSLSDDENYYDDEEKEMRMDETNDDALDSIYDHCELNQQRCRKLRRPVMEVVSLAKVLKCVVQSEDDDDINERRHNDDDFGDKSNELIAEAYKELGKMSNLIIDQDKDMRRSETCRHDRSETTREAAENTDDKGDIENTMVTLTSSIFDSVPAGSSTSKTTIEVSSSVPLVRDTIQSPPRILKKTSRPPPSHDVSSRSLWDSCVDIVPPVVSDDEFSDDESATEKYYEDEFDCVEFGRDSSEFIAEFQLMIAKGESELFKEVGDFKGDVTFDGADEYSFKNHFVNDQNRSSSLCLSYTLDKFIEILSYYYFMFW